ncbi:MAG: fatty acyl-AMP ligase, partial [Acidobacteriota bacterium]
MSFENLYELLHQRAAGAPDVDAYVYLVDGETDEERLTLGDLERRARALASRLQRRRVAGKPVLLCFPPGLDYIEAFFACVYAGAIAVPAYPPEPARHKRTMPRLKAILEDCGAELAITRGELLAPTRELWAEYGGKSNVDFIAADDAESDAEATADDWRPPQIDPADPAFLMYTSGSTGQPKGVVISHANALHNITAFHGFRERPCRAFVSWLPLFHDLGLVVATLYPLFQRAPSIFMSPASFMQRPLRWLEAISRFRATATAGPNFAYELCIVKSTPEERASLDLSCLDFALSGAEPVRASTLDRFTEAFAPHGFRREAFYPAYGLSDATADATGASRLVEPSLVTVDRRELEELRVRRVDDTSAEDAGAVTLVGCGESLPGQRLAIVDLAEEREITGEDRVGEVWLSGPSIGQGYWNRPEETERRFGATLDGGDDRFFRTDDLGFMHGGELYLIGRSSDLIILHGSNYFPEDIEPTVASSHAAVRPGCCAVFGAEYDEEERLVAVCEVNPRRLAEAGEEGDAGDVVRAIRRAIG